MWPSAVTAKDRDLETFSAAQLAAGNRYQQASKDRDSEAAHRESQTRCEQAAKDRDSEAFSASQLAATNRYEQAARDANLEGFRAKKAAAEDRSRKKQSKKCNGTEWGRIRNFLGNTRNGLAFACLNCRRTWFYIQVQRFN